MKYEKLGAILVRQGKIQEQDLLMCLAVQGSHGGRRRLGRILVDQHCVREEDVACAMAQQAGWDYYDGSLPPDFDLLNALGVQFLKERCAFPVRINSGTAFVLTDTFQTGLTDELRALCGPATVFLVGAPCSVKQAFSALREDEKNIFREEKNAADKGMEDPVYQLLFEALSAGATDIHIEPSPSSFESRLRIDGVLHFHRSWPLKEHTFFVNRLFSRAEISAGDFLRFHDARFEFEFEGRTVDIRLSHLPSINGSALVLRVLDRNREAWSLEKLGYAAQHLAVIGQALRRPHGLILMTGPTGCGKTTGLYAMVEKIKNIEVKIVSVEDPVEVRSAFVTQVGVDLRKGHDFPDVTRALLRHDPDIVLIGEIRDEKTAREAVRAAETGHRVLSTLHTNDATGAFLRLRDLGVDWSHLAAALNCVISQRLVRKLCCECKKKFDFPQGASPGDGLYIPESMERMSVPAGCSLCRNGFRGRTVVAEVFAIDDASRFLIEQGLMSELVARQKTREGFLSIQSDARRLVGEGVLSVCEAARVLG